MLQIKDLCISFVEKYIIKSLMVFMIIFAYLHLVIPVKYLLMIMIRASF